MTFGLSEPEQFRSLLTVLSRIADVLEEQNRVYAENAAKDEEVTQKRREEVMTIEYERIEMERHILALHKLNATQEQAWREKQEELLEKQTREIIAQNTRTYERWLTIMQEEKDKA